MKGPFNTADEKEKKAVELLTKNNNYKEVNLDGIFKFSTIDVEVDGKIVSLVSFRMPNGDLSRVATKVLFKQSQVNGFVMVGAGGSLSKDSDIGNYQVTTQSRLEGKKTISINPNRILPLPIKDNKEICSSNNSNVTVISPPVETREWLQKAKTENQSVDVETYFIMEALDEAIDGKHEETKVFPGLFISDQVEGHPLVEKIDINNAWKELSNLLTQSLNFFNVPDKRSGSGKEQ